MSVAINYVYEHELYSLVRERHRNLALISRTAIKDSAARYGEAQRDSLSYNVRMIIIA